MATAKNKVILTEEKLRTINREIDSISIELQALNRELLSVDSVHIYKEKLKLSIARYSYLKDATCNNFEEKQCLKVLVKTITFHEERLYFLNSYKLEELLQKVVDSIRQASNDVIELPQSPNDVIEPSQSYINAKKSLQSATEIKDSFISLIREQQQKMNIFIDSLFTPDKDTGNNCNAPESNIHKNTK